eukprot:1592285-Lingulodinium_polyedra.AAC.1
MGWPSFDNDGKYLGPLGQPVAGLEQLVGQSREGSFRTGPSAAWPHLLCEALAERIVRHFQRAGGCDSSVGHAGASEVSSSGA